MPQQNLSPDEKPPFFRTWWGMYALVIGNLVLLMALFWLFGWVYR